MIELKRQEIEQNFCGMLMRDKRALSLASTSGLKAYNFAIDLHGAIFEACRALWTKGEATTVASIAALVGVEHSASIKLLRDVAPIGQAFEPYLLELRNASREDEIKSRLLEISQAISSRRVFQPMTDIQRRIGDLLMCVDGTGDDIRTVSAAEAVRVSLERLEARVISAKEGRPPGIPTGIRRLDEVIYGLQPNFLYIVGARTGIGKTTFACNVALAASHAGVKVAFVSVEMDSSDIADKLIIREGLLNGSRYLTGKLADDEIDRVMHGARKVGLSSIYLVEPTTPAIDSLRLELMRLVKSEGVQLVIVDYIQQFKGHAGKSYRSPREETMDVSTALKNLARQLEIPVVALSQLSRMAPETGEPELTHLAESDQIGRDADAVLMIFKDARDDYSIAVKKQRRGPSLTIKLDVDLVSGKFSGG